MGKGRFLYRTCSSSLNIKQPGFTVNSGWPLHIKILRHPSLHMGLWDMYSSIQAYKSHNERAIHGVRKINVENKCFHILSTTATDLECSCLFCHQIDQYIGFKPIFHQNAKYLALGVGVGQCPRCQNFAFGIPTFWYLGANANPGVGSNLRYSRRQPLTPVSGIYVALGPKCKFLALAMYISFFWCRFHLFG